METEVRKIIEAASSKVLANSIVDSFKDVEKNFTLSSWKTAELDAGHFVEGVRRLIEKKLFGTHFPIGKTLPPLNQKELSRYENAKGSDSYRTHIPRLLIGIYGIRNKRGVGHLAAVSPNYMDAAYVISSCKWVLAEIVRLESGRDARETSKIIDQVVERNLEGIWKEGEITRIIADGLTLRESTLFLLFDDSPRQDEDMRKIIECRNKNYYKKILNILHSLRLIEYSKEGICILSPKGRLEAEKIIHQKILPGR